MFGSYRIRGCVCGFARKEKKRCSCGKARYHYRYDVTDPVTGKRKQKETRGFPTKQEAEDEAKRILAELAGGTYVEEKDAVFETFANQWLREYTASGKVKPSTADIRRIKLNIILNYFSQIKIKDITKKMYQDMLNELKSKYAKKTVMSVHETGSLILKKAMALQIVSKDITEGADLFFGQKTVEELEEETAPPKYLEKEELALFLKTVQTAKNPIYYYLFLTIAYTGMRKGEALALKWRDVDFEAQTISITKTAFFPANNLKAYTLLTPKTKSSRRVIEIDDDERVVLNALEKLRAEQEAIKDANYNDEGFVFARFGRFAGMPILPGEVTQQMKRSLKACGLNQSFSAHSLRHTHTSLLAEAGVSLEQIKQRLGHHGDKITERIYLHVTKARKTEAARKFGELMRGVDKRKRRKAKLIRKP